MDLEGKHYAAGGGLLIGALLLSDGLGLPSDLQEAQQRLEETSGSVIDRVQEVSTDGELVVDPVSGVFYDDPEEGPLNDEEGDDRNISFDAVNDALSSIGESIDPTTYAPDVEDGAAAPDSGVLPDAGDSQNWGDAPEAENDDLTERTANSNLSDESKATWDRFANQDHFSDDDEEDDGGSSGSTSDSDGSDSDVPVNTVEDDVGWIGGSSGGSSSSDDGGSSDVEPDTDEDGEWLVTLPDDV